MAARNSSDKKRGTVLSEEKPVTFFELAIDYPQNGEVVMPGHYAIRVSGAPGLDVEVSTNGGAWQTCRSAAGYYWCDWWAESGQISIAARSKNAGGDWQKTKERRVTVSSSGRN